MKAAENTVFLIDNVNLTQISDDTVVGWRTTPEELWSVVREEECET